MRASEKKLELARITEQDPRWTAVLAKDSSADGKFYYAVRTTGVYCRPSCPARPAKPENVEFYDNIELAKLAGYRPCKRCKPDGMALADQHALKVTEACRIIEASETMPTLEELAGKVDMSVYHFHRTFKAVTGLTPKAYAVAHRAKSVRTELGNKHTVTQAIFDAGYNSNSRFYAKSSEILGMTPSKYRAGGKNTEIRFAIGECSLGAILVAATDQGICAISLGNDPVPLVNELQDRFPNANLIGADAVFEDMVAKVVGFIEAPSIGLDLPLDVRGTAFQQRVWQALREIPAGVRVSYTDIAERIGSPKAVRAVAGACAANTLAVAIPCHRVVRSDGDLSGYRWGVERKKALLERESAV